MAREELARQEGTFAIAEDTAAIGNTGFVKDTSIEAAGVALAYLHTGITGVERIDILDCKQLEAFHILVYRIEEVASRRLDCFQEE
jgi:hypothetical protein